MMPKNINNFWLKALVSLGGIGNLPLMPGTYATAATLLILWLMSLYLPWAVLAAAISGILVISFFACVLFGKDAEQAYNRKDPAQVVIDETAGACVAVLAIPGDFLYVVLGGFVLFRIFDVWKPWPIKQIQHLRGGWGIVLDDILAGIYANVILRIVFLVWVLVNGR